VKETQTELVFISSAVTKARKPVCKVHIFLQNGGCNKTTSTLSMNFVTCPPKGVFRGIAHIKLNTGASLLLWCGASLPKMLGELSNR
jgi:hypothetical protein